MWQIIGHIFTNGYIDIYIYIYICDKKPKVDKSKFYGFWFLHDSGRIFHLSHPAKIYVNVNELQLKKLICPTIKV